jgi:hypothetical protein
LVVVWLAAVATVEASWLASSAEAVSERAGGQDDGREREGVGVDDPLQAGQAGSEVIGDAGEGGVDDRDVEHEHRRGGADHGERPALRCRERSHGLATVPLHRRGRHAGSRTPHVERPPGVQ